MSDIYLKLHSGPQPAADWATSDPLIAQFEMAANSDNNKVKVNFASTPALWSTLSYWNPSDSTTDVAAAIHAATGKTTPADNDELGIVDSAASNILKKVTWANIKATLKAYFDTLYPAISQVVITAAKVFSVTNTLTFSGTDGTTMTFPGVSSNIGYLESPINSQSNDYTCVLADSGKTVLETGASKTITIPANASVAYPVGTVLSFICTNASGCSIAITSDTMTLVNSTTTGTRTLAQNGMASAIKMTSTTWLIAGAGLT